MATVARKSLEKLNFSIELSCVEHTAMCRGMRTDLFGRGKRAKPSNGYSRTQCDRESSGQLRRIIDFCDGSFDNGITVVLEET